MAESIKNMKIKCNPAGVVAAAAKDADRREAVMAHKLPGTWYMVADVDSKSRCAGNECFPSLPAAQLSLSVCEDAEPYLTWAIFKMSLIKPLVLDPELDEVEAQRLHNSAMLAMSPKLEA